MKQEEFNFILKEGEGQFIEFKENLDKSLAKEMVAFANASGGRIFLGVTDKGEVRGINITNELKAQVLDIAHNCDPSVSIKLEVYKNILIIELIENKNKPYSCSQGFYLRNGAQSPKMSRDDILEFSISEGRKIFKKIKEKNHITAEELSKVIGINNRNIEKNLSKLQELGIIKRVGPDKGGHWEVKR
jgi:ATP-dependent DNA helicase RecG